MQSSVSKAIAPPMLHHGDQPASASRATTAMSPTGHVHGGRLGLKPQHPICWIVSIDQVLGRDLEPPLP